MTAPPYAELWGALFAAGLAVTVVGLSRARSRWTVPACVAVLAAPIAASLLDPELRVFSHHGFLHASYVESILARGLPPTDPLLAERPLGYAWPHHAAIAGLVRVTGWHASTVFALVNVALAGLCVAWLLVLARRVFGQTAPFVLAPLLALYGASPFPRGPFARALAAIGLEGEGRVIPIQKFASVNSNPLGIVCFVWGLDALVRLVDPQDGEEGRARVHLFGATLGAALFYPLAWAPLVAVAGLAGLGVALRRGDARAALGVWAGAALASLLAAPFLLSLQAGRATPSLALDLSWGHALGGLGRALVVLGPPALVLLFARRASEPAAFRPGSLGVLGAAVAVGVGLHVTLSAGMRSEYKFLALAALALGFAAGGALAPFVRKRPAIGIALVALLLLPAGSFFGRAVLAPWGDVDSVRIQAGRLEAVDADRAALHAWARGAPADAVFVDASLDLPPFAGRRLYVAPDPGPGSAPGWGVVPSAYLTEVVGHPVALVRERALRSERLLNARPTPADLAALARELGDAPVYVVARSPAARGRLRAAPGFEEAFASGSLGAYHLSR